MIWEPFMLALVLGIIVSAGLYFAYLWPSVEPVVEPIDDAGAGLTEEPRATAETAVAVAEETTAAAEQATDVAAGSDAAPGPAASPAP